MVIAFVLTVFIFEVVRWTLTASKVFDLPSHKTVVHLLHQDNIIGEEQAS